MPILPFQPDVLKHTVTRITVGHRIQIDTEPSIILNARLIGTDGTVAVIVYTDDEANYIADNPETAESEQDLIALVVSTGTSDAQNPLAPPTRADFGIFIKAEGTASKEGLVELTYVHRCDYESSFEPIQVSTWLNPLPPLDNIYSLGGVPPWVEGTDSPPPPGEEGGDGLFNADGKLLAVGEPPPPEGGGDGGGIILSSFGTQLIEGTTDTIDVTLGPDAPVQDVILSVTSAATGDVTASPSTLTFTSANYATKQTVTVTAVNDAATESAEFVNVTLALTTGDGASYTSANTDNEVYVVKVIDTDTDSAGVNVNMTSFALLEGAAVTPAKVTLTAAPTADVLVELGNISGDGYWQVGVSSSYATTKTLTFTSSNWATAQVLQVRGVDNATVDGTRDSQFVYRVTSSSDVDYNALTTSNFFLPVVVYDNDADNFSVGEHFFLTEHLDVESSVQYITTESGAAFIRTE